MIEIAAQLFVLTMGYVIGSLGVILPFKFMGVAINVFSNASLLVLLLPLVCVNVIEAFTHLWLRTPGTLGFGGLTVFVPMLVAGMLAGSGLLVAFRVIGPFDPSLPRSSESLTAWVVLALICAAITIALWRYWPEPRARLF